MTTSYSVAQTVAELTADLSGGLEFAAGDISPPDNVTFLDNHRAARPTPASLTECVPLLAIALEFVDRGPAAITIEGVEHYRANAMRLLDRVRPVIERHSGTTLASWATKLSAPPSTAMQPAHSSNS